MKKIIPFFFGSLALAFQSAAIARQPLTFEARVKAQEAIERVYYNHRIWPKENPTPKPPFEQMVPRAALETKVNDYLKKSAALGEFWQRPIAGEQLQAEMDRMANGTKDPATLQELFGALKNDPYLIAECLARPILADRLIRSWYANDERFHADTKAKAEAALAEAAGGSLSLCSSGSYQKVMYVLSDGEERASRQGRIDRHEIALDTKSFEKELRQSPEEGKAPIMKEMPEAFLLIGTTMKTQTRVEIETVAFPKRPLEDWLKTVGASGGFAPASSASYDFVAPTFSATPCGEGWYNGILDDVPDPRYEHTAVWTGSEMIVWGGNDSSHGLNTGGRYSPATDTWTPTSRTIGCPSGRIAHTAVWTGTEMIVWGGYDGNYLNSGGRYDPSTDTWTQISAGINCPSARVYHTAVWTGTEMIIWGGAYQDTTQHYVQTGGRYNPSTDSWTLTPIGPSARAGHTAIWTGTEMIVWGGVYYDGTTWYFLNTGGRYKPSNNAWTATPVTANCPSGRRLFTAVWTGTEMIVWGGGNSTYSYLNTGGRYNPRSNPSNSWTPTSTGANCAEARCYHTAVWSGSEMIIWGGDGGCYNRGGRYNPSNDTWTQTSYEAGCPSYRSEHTAVWTGTEMIVWGGQNSYGSGWWLCLNSGGRYSPSTDTWTPTSTGTNSPSARYRHTTVWTGTEMIICGGSYYFQGNYYYANGDKRYNPALDSWTSISSEWSIGSDWPTAVWTGQEMIVWGGNTGAQDTNRGGRYNPTNDSWLPTSTGANCPSERCDHTAIWTGSEMIIWGGDVTTLTGGGTGGRYNPSTNTWVPTATGAQCPSARYRHTAVWTGSEMIVWGGHVIGYPYYDCLNSGGRYNPSTDCWTPTATGANCPSPRFYQKTVWTGSEMIVWGGVFSTDQIWNILDTGGRYNPFCDSWKETSTTNAPLGRYLGNAIWTGMEMIVWGGCLNDPNVHPLDTGGLYDPSSDTWRQTPIGGHCPSARWNHTAVWSGTSMIIWGGGARQPFPRLRRAVFSSHLHKPLHPSRRDGWDVL